MTCFYLNTFYSIATFLYFCTITSFDSHYHQHHCHCFDYYCCYYYVVVFFITVIAIIISFFFNAFNFYCSTFYDSILYLPINRTFLNFKHMTCRTLFKVGKKDTEAISVSLNFEHWIWELWTLFVNLFF